MKKLATRADVHLTNGARRFEWEPGQGHIMSDAEFVRIFAGSVTTWIPVRFVLAIEVENYWKDE